MIYTLFAQWFGIVTVVLALGILFHLEDAKKLSEEFVNSSSGYIMGGVLPLVFGTLCFLHNHSFHADWHLVVSLAGLVMMVLGALRVLFVCHWRAFFNKHIDKVPVLFSLFGLILGLLLLYAGFIAHMV